MSDNFNKIIIRSPCNYKKNIFNFFFLMYDIKLGHGARKKAP